MFDFRFKPCAKSPEPAVGAVRSAVAVHAASRRRLLLRCSLAFMKILLSCLFASCLFISARAQSLDPSDVLKQDGILRVSDGSSYYEFRTNGTFHSFPVSVSGRTFDGSWTSSAGPYSITFTVTAKMGWLNGIQPQPDDWKIVLRVDAGLKRPADRLHMEVFDGYFIFEELTKIPKPAK